MASVIRHHNDGVDPRDLFFSPLAEAGHSPSVEFKDLRGMTDSSPKKRKRTTAWPTDENDIEIIQSPKKRNYEDRLKEKKAVRSLVMSTFWHVLNRFTQ